jgi:putative addiction module component (TIGR02574 family)
MNRRLWPIKHALELPPEDRFALVDGILQSPDEPDKTVDELWLDEAEKRLIAFREGRTKVFPVGKVFEELF